MQSKKHPTICLNMIVKNESKVIRECLDCVYSLIDTYVIVDTGSTDNTEQEIIEFFNAKGISGKVIKHDFSTCSCHPDAYQKTSKYFHFAENRSYALKQCKGKADYVFFMDADDRIEGTLTFPKKLTADQYWLNMRTDMNTYYKPLLIKNDPKLKWEWLSGLHEFLEGRPKTSVHIQGNYSIESRRLGNRNEDPMKYYKDVAFLEELIKSETNKEMLIRYRYYYAQSWFDAKEYKKSIEAYQTSINDGGDPDRNFSARYMICRAHVLKGSSDDEIESVFKDCFEKHKNRAEPLFQLLNHFNGKGDFQKAYDYGVQALDIPMPQNTRFYIDKQVYEYRLLDELVYAASNLHKYRQALRWCHKLMKDKKYPQEAQQTITQNILALTELLEKQAETKNATKKQVHIEGRPSLCIYTGPSPMFSKEFFGSELAVKYLAHEFSSRYNVTIACDNYNNEESDDPNIIYIDSVTIPDHKFDIMIISRYVNYFVEYDANAIATKTYMWLHDIDFHTYWNRTQLPNRGIPLVKNIDHLVTGYITLSPWHKDEIIATYNVPSEKVHVIGNGINVRALPASVSKVPGKFVWVSDYTRGLIDLISQFPKILKVMPHAHLDVYRKLPDQLTEELKHKSFVTLKGHAANDQVLQGIAEAEYFFYPTQWRETYCISALEAQALGCVCITSNVAALKTTVADRGILLKKEPGTEEFWEEAITTIQNFENDKNMKLEYISKGVSWGRNQSWTEKANEWAKLI